MVIYLAGKAVEKVFSFQGRQTVFPSTVRLAWTPKHSSPCLTTLTNSLHLQSLLLWPVVNEVLGSQWGLRMELSLPDSRGY